MAICTNEGRCETIARPPRMVVLEPEVDTRYPEGTREIRVSGEVESAAPQITVSVTPNNDNGCAGGPERSVTLRNENEGQFARIPFVIDGVVLDPGASRIEVEARVGAGRRTITLDVAIDCPGCATIDIEQPNRRSSVAGLQVPRLFGSVDPGSVTAATWRVHSYEGDVIDGPLAVSAGRFAVDRVPLFPGLNRLEVVVSGVGSGLGESRCSTVISAGTALESGLRAILVWNGASADLDLHIVGPSGRFGDPLTSLSSRGRGPYFGGTIEDDPEGFGPEVARIQDPPNGTYGIVVEPVVDGTDFGSDAILRLLYEGGPLVHGPIGPRHLTSLDGKLWIPGKVVIESGNASWVPIDQTVPGSAPPVTSPETWPAFF
jgi:hypothetical protein